MRLDGAAEIMNVLAIDTASPNPAVSLCTGETLFAQALPSDRRSSEELLPAIQRVLAASRTSLQECDRLAVCSGPGSFTGIRIGLATAWGLGRASGIPVETVSTLEAMAEAARPGDGRSLAAALDAGRGEAVMERFDISGLRARSLAAGVRLPYAEIAPATRGDVLVTLPASLAGSPGVALAMLPACALALAVSRAPREASSPTLAASYSRPSAAEEKLGAS